LKRLIAFDLDGTLAKSKSPLDAEMSSLLGALLGIVRVAIISGGDWPQFEKQILSHLPESERLANLSLLPTCGTKFRRYDGGWKELYCERLTAEERKTIVGSIRKGVAAAAWAVEKTWGETIEDRATQITYSALGQEAPLDAKVKWDPDYTKRKAIKAVMDSIIPEFSVRMGGTTSIDVTKLGIDKAYGIRKLRDHLGVSLSEMLFLGDAVFPGGNDFPAEEAGVDCIAVRDPEQTKRAVEAIVACLEPSVRANGGAS
jgi:phosphomannomutase